MKYLPIVLATLMAMGTFAMAQDNTAPARPEKPAMSENQRGPRGPQFRGGPRGEQMRKEILQCPQCQKHMKHMQNKHFKGKGKGIEGKGPQGKHLMGPPQHRSDGKGF